MFDRAFDCVEPAFDPEIHAVAGYHTRPLDLFEHAELEFRIDIAKENVFGRAIFFGNDRFERLEDVELRVQRPSLVEVVSVFAFPPEGLARCSREALDVDLMLAEDLDVFVAKISPDHGNHAHRRKVACSYRKIRCRATKYFFGFPERRLYRVERHRAHNKNGCSHFRFTPYSLRFRASSFEREPPRRQI